MKCCLSCFKKAPHNGKANSMKEMRVIYCLFFLKEIQEPFGSSKQDLPYPQTMFLEHLCL